VMNFCIVVRVPSVITYANLGDDQFRGFEGAGVEFSTFPLTSGIWTQSCWKAVFVQCGIINLPSITLSFVSCL